MLEALIEIAKLIFSVNFILTVITASTPLLLAGAGELVVERSGVLNLGVEGMMIMGAACGFAGAYLSGSNTIGALCGVLAGMALAAVFGALTLGLAVNQVATGLALTILGTGLSGLIGRGFIGERIVPVPNLDLPVLTGLPVVGRIVFGQDAFAYFSIALVIAIWLFLYHSRPGLVLRAVGDNHTSAHALGYPVLKISAAGGAVRRRLRGSCRRFSAARLYAVLRSGHDRGARLDRGCARRVRIVAAVPVAWRRLPVRSGDVPAAFGASAGAGYSTAIDVVVALPCNGRRPGIDFA